MYIIFLCDTAGVLLYSIYVDFDILSIIENYDIEQYTLASIRLTLDTIGMFSVLTLGGKGRRLGSRHTRGHFVNRYG